MSAKPRFQELREAIELADCPNILEQLVKYNSTVEKNHEPMNWRHELSFGRAARPLNEEPLTRLNAKRMKLEDW
jgi:hypothetical protein